MSELLPITNCLCSEDLGWNAQAEIHERGKPTQGVSKSFFEHTLFFLGAMRCWKADEVTKPWTTVIRYTVPCTEILPCENSNHDVSERFVECTERGETNGFVFWIHDAPDHARVHVTDHLTCYFSCTRKVFEKRFFHASATYSNVVVERKKTFTYCSSAKWEYTLVVRWSTPCVASTKTTVSKQELPILFCTSPTYHVILSCQPTQALSPQYVAESMWCKISDILPQTQSIANMTVSLPFDGVIIEDATPESLGIDKEGASTTNTTGAISAMPTESVALPEEEDDDDVYMGEEEECDDDDD